MHKSGNELSLDLHKSGNELSLDLHKSGNEISLELHKSGNELSLDLHINKSPKWNSSLLDIYDFSLSECIYIFLINYNYCLLFSVVHLFSTLPISVVITNSNVVIGHQLVCYPHPRWGSSPIGKMLHEITKK